MQLKCDFELALTKLKFVRHTRQPCFLFSFCYLFIYKETPNQNENIQRVKKKKKNEIRRLKTDR